MTRQECEEKLYKFQMLKKNWDSYDSDPPSLFSIEAARTVCEFLIDNDITNFNIFPIYDAFLSGGVSIQFLDINDKIVDIDFFDDLARIFISKKKEFYYRLINLDYCDSHYKEIILESLSKSYEERNN